MAQDFAAGTPIAVLLFGQRDTETTLHPLVESGLSSSLNENSRGRTDHAPAASQPYCTSR